MKNVYVQLELGAEHSSHKIKTRHCYENFCKVHFLFEKCHLSFGVIIELLAGV